MTNNIDPAPINKSMDYGKWKFGSASLMLDSILIEFHEKASVEIKSKMAGISKHGKFLRKQSCINCVVIRTISLDIMLMMLNVPIDIKLATIETSRFTMG